MTNLGVASEQFSKAYDPGIRFYARIGFVIRGFASIALAIGGSLYVIASSNEKQEETIAKLETDVRQSNGFL